MDDITLIKFLGETSEVARMCDISSQAVSQWKTNGIPKSWRKFLSNEAKKKQRRESRKDVTQ